MPFCFRSSSLKAICRSTRAYGLILQVVRYVLNGLVTTALSSALRQATPDDWFIHSCRYVRLLGEKV
ncbi:unnamed protein product [Heterobilharzia americana]|nr:unnamed protein product [Heterobilharzia americana]